MERTAISRKPAELARQELDSLRDCDLMTPDLILCAEKSYEHVELLRLEEGGMYVAEYLTDLPPRRLHEAIRLAREQIAVREGVEEDVGVW